MEYLSCYLCKRLDNLIFQFIVELLIITLIKENYIPAGINLAKILRKRTEKDETWRIKFQKDFDRVWKPETRVLEEKIDQLTQQLQLLNKRLDQLISSQSKPSD